MYSKLRKSLPKRYVLTFFLKAASDLISWICVGRLFQSLGAVAENISPLKLPACARKDVSKTME